MKPIFIYFKEIPLDQNNRFTLYFSNTDIVYEIHFSSNNDYFLTSMNCNLDLFKDFEAHGDLFDDIKNCIKWVAYCSKKAPPTKMILKKPSYGEEHQELPLNVPHFYFNFQMKLLNVSASGISFTMLLKIKWEIVKFVCLMIISSTKD